MADINKAGREFREMDDLAMQDSPIHAIAPLAKLLTTITYIFIVASYNKYDLSGLLIMILYPALMFSLSGISVLKCLYKLRFILPLVMAVGIFNPFFDKKLAFYLGHVPVNMGFISMLTLMLKGIFCLMASFLLASTTTIDEICLAFRKIRLPKVFVTLILLVYRYITVMLDEVSIMYMSYSLRAPGQKGIHISAWGSFLGQLLLRSQDKAEELYLSMRLRGFTGEFDYRSGKKAGIKDYLFFLIWFMLFITFRLFNVVVLAGNLFT